MASLFRPFSLDNLGGLALSEVTISDRVNEFTSHQANDATCFRTIWIVLTPLVRYKTLAPTLSTLMQVPTAIEGEKKNKRRNKG